MEEVSRAFQLFDGDNAGKISLRNLRQAAKEIDDRLEDPGHFPPYFLIRLATDKLRLTNLTLTKTERSTSRNSSR